MLVRVARNTAAQALSLAVQFVDRFVVVGILIRGWGTAVYADWAVLLSCAGLLSLGELGLNIYYGNAMQKAFAQGNAAAFQRTLSTALTCSFGVAAVLGIAGFGLLAVHDVGALAAVRVMTRADAVAILALMGLTALSRIARGSISQTFRGRQAFARGILVDLAGFTVTLSLVILAGTFGATPLGLAAVYLAGDVVAGWGLMVLVLKYSYPGLAIRPAVPTRPEIADMAHQAKWLAVHQGAPVAWLQLPVVLLSQLGTAGAGLVSFIVLRTLVNFVRSLATMLSLATGVESAASHHAGRAGDAVQHIRAVGYGLAILTTAISVGVLLFGPGLVALWTGRGDLYDAGVVSSLLTGLVLASPSAPIGSHMSYSNRARAPAMAFLVQLAIGLAACAALSRSYGPAGAAAGLAIGEVTGQAVLLPLLAAHQLGGFRFAPHMARCMSAMIATALWCVALGYAVLSVIDASTWAGLIVAGAAWGVLGAGPALIMALPGATRTLLMRRVMPRGARAARGDAPLDSTDLIKGR